MFNNQNFHHNGILYIYDVKFNAYRNSGKPFIHVFLTEQPVCSFEKKNDVVNFATGEVTCYVQTEKLSLKAGKVSCMKIEGEENCIEFLNKMSIFFYDGKNKYTKDIWSVKGMPYFGIKPTIKEYDTKNPYKSKDKVYTTTLLDWDAKTKFDMFKRFNEVHKDFVKTISEKFLSKVPQNTLMERFENYCNAVSTNMENKKPVRNDLMSKVAKTIISADEFALLKKKSSVELKQFCKNSEIPFQGNKSATIQHIYTNYVKPYKV